MRIIDRISAPGGQRPNEDRSGYSGAFAWVIDGATDLEADAFLPAGSDVQWLVDRVGAHLSEAGAAAGAGAAADRHVADRLLRSLSARIGQEMDALGFPPERIHPTCSIGLLIAGSRDLCMVRVGDPTCLAAGDGLLELSTDFFGRREAQAVGRSGPAGLEQEEARRGIVARRRQYIEGSLEESVFSGHPQARLKIASLTAEAERTEHVLLCTDGFARAVVDYHLYPGWPDLLRDALDNGLAAVLARIRTHEATGSASGDEGGRTTHFKKSDDATALLVEI